MKRAVLKFYVLSFAVNHLNFGNDVSHAAHFVSSKLVANSP